MSWETSRKIDLTVGLTHTGSVSMEWCMAFCGFYVRLSTTRRFYLSYSRGSPIDLARNHCADDCLRLGTEWLLFIDTDCIVVPDLFDRLVSKNLPVVAALYYRRHKPLHPAMWRIAPEMKKGGKYSPIVNYPRGQLIECDVIGMGAALFHRRVIEAVHHPPHDPMFVWTMGRENHLSENVRGHMLGGIGCSEDFYACEKIKEAGFKIFTATDIVLPHETQLKIVQPESTNIDEVKHGGIQFPNI